VLTARLRKLEQAGVIERRQYSQRPPRHEDLLTDAGPEHSGPKGAGSVAAVPGFAAAQHIPIVAVATAQLGQHPGV